MPYRHAHWWLLLLFPLTGLAFWPAYFGDFRAAPYAFHVHGLTASLWIALLAVQSWSIHRRRNDLHRAIGYGSFALFPFFLVGGLLVLQTMAIKVATQASPFYDLYGARLGTVDAVSVLALPAMYYAALARRRKVHEHARWLLGTVFFLIAPILSRLLPALPPLAITGPADFHRFAWSVHIANAAALILALALAIGSRKHGRPWLVVAALIVLQGIGFEFLGRSAAWQSAFTALGSLPTPLLAGIGFATAVAATWAGWIAAPPLPPRRTAAA